MKISISFFILYQKSWRLRHLPGREQYSRDHSAFHPKGSHIQTSTSDAAPPSEIPSGAAHAHEMNLLTAFILLCYSMACHGRTACSQHGIHNENLSVRTQNCGSLQQYSTVPAFPITIQADMPDFGCRNQVQHTVHHSQAFWHRRIGTIAIFSFSLQFLHCGVTDGCGDLHISQRRLLVAS